MISNQTSTSDLVRGVSNVPCISFVTFVISVVHMADDVCIAVDAHTLKVSNSIPLETFRFILF